MFRYVPPGSAGSVSQPSGGAAKGYFSGLRATNAGDNADKTDVLPTRAEMSATVKAAARAAASRVSGDKNGTAAAAAEKSKSGGGGRRDKIERDIFAARPSRGQALGVSAGGYDVYPETGDFETYDSDEVSFFFSRDKRKLLIFCGIIESDANVMRIQICFTSYGEHGIALANTCFDRNVFFSRTTHGSCL